MTLLSTFVNFFKKAVYYDSIYSTPIGIWIDLNQGNNLNLLIRSGVVSKKKLEAIYHKIYNEYLKKFGLTEEFKRYIESKRLYIYSICDYGIDPTPINKTKMQISERDFFAKQNEGESVDFDILYIEVEQAMGFKIDRMSTSINDFYNYVKFYKKQKEK